MFDGFVDHGVWARYQPDTVPADAPKSAMFARRSGDNQDWYDHVHPGTNFQETSAKFTVVIVQPTDTVPYAYTEIMAAAMDATAMFPSDNMRVIEMLGDYSGYTVEQLISYFSGKMIDLESGAITDPPAKDASKIILPAGMSGILKRLATLESKIGT